jgi:hypothetical protein
VTRLNEILKAAPMDWETRNRLERSLIDVDWVLNHFAANARAKARRENQNV